MDLYVEALLVRLDERSFEKDITCENLSIHVRFEQFLAIEFKQIDRFLNGVSPRRTKSVFKNKALSWKYTSLIKNFLRDNRFSYSIVAKPFRFQSLPCKTALDAYFRHTLFWLLMLKTLSNMPAQIRQKMLKCHLFGWFLNFCTKMAPLAKKIIIQASLYLKLSYENNLFALGILLIGKRGGVGLTSTNRHF